MLAESGSPPPFGSIIDGDSTWKRWWPLALCIGLYVAIGASVGLWHSPEVDERLFHVPSTLQFARQFPHFDLVRYPSASGPLPYVLLAAWVKLFGPSLVGLRVAIALFGLGTLIVIWKLLAEDSLDRATLALLLIFTNPYFIFRSFSVYSIIPALFFALAGLACFMAYQRRPERRVALVGCVLMMSCAVLSRQNYLSYAIGLLAFATLSQLGRLEHAGIPTFKPGWTALAFMMTPVLLVLALFRLWGGTTPPAFARFFVHAPLSVRQLDFVPLFFGFWFWPLALENLHRLPRWLPIVALLLALHRLVTPLDSWVPGDPETVMGTIARLYGELRVRGVPFELLRVSQALFWAIGIVALVVVLRDGRRPHASIALAHIGVLATIPLVYERYYLELSAVVWLGAARAMRSRPLYVALILQSAAITILYFFVHA